MTLSQRPHVVKVFTAKTTSGDAGTLDNVTPRSAHTLQVNSGAGVSAGVVTLEASLDGTTFSSLGTVTTNAASSSFFFSIADKPFRYLRARVSTTITGGSVDAYVCSV